MAGCFSCITICFPTSFDEAMSGMTRAVKEDQRTKSRPQRMHPNRYCSRGNKIK